MLQDIVAHFTKQDYALNKPFIVRIAQGDREVMDTCIAAIKQTLSSTTLEPDQHLYALRFAKDTVETFNQDYIDTVERSLSDVVAQIASFRKDSNDEGRGVTYFNNTPTKQQQIMGNSLVRLALDLVRAWAIWFPAQEDGTATRFTQVYDRLMNDVAFPRYQYFKPDVLTQDYARQRLKPRQQVGVPKQQSQHLQITPGAATPIDNLTRTEHALQQVVAFFTENPVQGDTTQLAILNTQLEDLLLADQEQKAEEDEDYQLKLIEAQERTDAFLNLFQQYQKKEISYQQFRSEYVQTDEQHQKMQRSYQPVQHSAEMAPQPPSFQAQHESSSNHSLLPQDPHPASFNQAESSIKQAQPNNSSINQQDPQQQSALNQLDYQEDKYVPAEEDIVQYANNSRYRKSIQKPSIANKQQIQRPTNKEQIDKQAELVVQLRQQLQDEKEKHEQQPTQQHDQYLEAQPSISQPNRDSNISPIRTSDLEQRDTRLKQLEDENSDLLQQVRLLEQHNRVLETQLVERYQQSSYSSSNNEQSRIKIDVLTQQLDLLQLRYDELDTEYTRKLFEIDELTKSLEQLKSANAKSFAHNTTVKSRERAIQQRIFAPQKVDTPLSSIEHRETVQDKPPFLQQIILNCPLDPGEPEEPFNQPNEPPLNIQQMIFPYKSTIDYYRSQQRDYKGELIQHNSKHSFKDLNSLSARNQYLLFKSCSEWKSQLYEHPCFLVFQQSQQMIYQRKTYLSVTVQIRNTDMAPIRLQITSQRPCPVQPEPRLLVLSPQETAQYEFMILNQLDGVPEIELTVQLKQGHIKIVSYRKILMYLPSTLLRMLQVQPLSATEFKLKWKQFSDSMIRSSSTSIRSQSMFKKLLNDFTPLNTHRQTDIDFNICDQKLGAAFFHHDQIYYVKVINQPTKQFLVQICCESTDQEATMKDILMQMQTIHGC